MGKLPVCVIGAVGFVGRAVFERLSVLANLELVVAVRKPALELVGCAANVLIVGHEANTD